jgi:hypothetical protein
MTGPYLPHQQRVVDECRELNERLGKLQAFMGTGSYRTASPAEQVRLMRQAAVMREYSGILDARIKNFGGPN